MSFQIKKPKSFYNPFKMKSFYFYDIEIVYFTFSPLITYIKPFLFVSSAVPHLHPFSHKHTGAHNLNSDGVCRVKSRTNPPTVATLGFNWKPVNLWISTLLLYCTGTLVTPTTCSKLLIQSNFQSIIVCWS